VGRVSTRIYGDITPSMPEFRVNCMRENVKRLGSDPAKVDNDNRNGGRNRWCPGGTQLDWGRNSLEALPVSGLRYLVEASR
jgi:hypothetical protein